ncbi:unnamed protein product [Cochlearia groenlandica]
MSKPVMLVFLLVILIVTSQFEWRQPLLDQLDAAPSLAQKHRQISNKEEAVKEKILLSQERHIQKLNDLVRSLETQLLRCKGDNATETFNVTKEFERKHIAEN